ncbi:hypothetical protein [Hyphomicrobium sp. CS1GBMeth3]|uniref:hypothetical protein n=1 Tax=Hyphomicrobium sp. CS1GBMeth3 TaxID=1892845 RepID=UPI0009317969|nr:hypothetical protein [Hyphomicrobium sp. CS1GBMeth3]
MLGSAKGQGFAPIFDDRLRAGGCGSESSRFDRGSLGAHPTRRGERRGLSAVTRFLDGVSGLGWSVIGFVGGAVFWHFVGFWGFVSDVVLSGGAPSAAERAAWHSGPPAQDTAVAQVTSTASHGCTLLSLDRLTGRTSARPCDVGHQALAQDAFQGREDRVGARR